MARGTVITDTANSGTSQGGEEERPENDSDSDSGVGGRGKREREEDSEYGAAPIPYKVGQHIDVLDSVDRWAEAKVLKIDADNKRLYVSFLYWSHHFDTWIHDIPRRCAFIHTHTYVPGGVLRVGQRLDVLDEVNKWLEAFVTDESPSEVLIHFKGWSPKFDVWLSRDSPRIRQFGFGENYRNRAIIPQKTWSVPGNPKGAVIDRTRKISALSDNYAKYKNALSSKGLHLFPVAGDGNCLFRSVAHQIYGDDALHDLVREKCMDYMEVNSAFFAMFVEGGIENFHRYIAMKRQLTCWGDDPEIQAICEIYGRPAEIWSFDLHQGARRLRTYHEAGTGGEAATISAALRLSFYGGGHYDSIVGPAFNGFLLTTRPGLVEDTSIARARCLIDSGDRPRHSIARFSDTDSLAASDVEATDNAALEMALSTSRKEMEAFGEEDIETCLALSLSCMVAEAKSSSGVSDLSSVPGRKNTESSAAHSMSEGAKYSELDSDEKAVLDLVLKESVNDIKRADELLGPVTEEEIIEAQLLEQVRQESLKQSSGLFSSRSDSKCSSETFTMPASSCRPIPQQDEFEFAIQQSEQEMLEEAIRMSQNVAYGNADVCSASLSGNNQMVSAVDEDEMLRMAIMQSVEMASSPDTRNNDYRTGGGSNCSNNNNDDDDDDDLHRAIAASIQYR